MEVTTAREVMEQGTTLADSVNAYIEANGITKAALAREVNYSRSAVSQYLSGKYESNPDEIEEKLTAYMRRVAGGQGVSVRAGVFLTKDAQSVLGVCKSCQDDAGFGIVVGKSGYGKTFTLKEYAKARRAVYIECDDSMGRWDLVELLEKRLGAPATSGSIWKRVNGIRDFLNANSGYLLIIDEADKLINKNTQKKMELLRGIFDQADVGIVIAGEPKLESQIREYLDRLANRIDFYASLSGLTEKEIGEYLAAYVVDDDARTELTRRARGDGGCFRLFDRTLRNCCRVMNWRETQRLSMEIIREASQMMML